MCAAAAAHECCALVHVLCATRARPPCKQLLRSCCSPAAHTLPEARFGHLPMHHAPCRLAHPSTACLALGRPLASSVTVAGRARETRPTSCSLRSACRHCKRYVPRARPLGRPSRARVARDARTFTRAPHRYPYWSCVSGVGVLVGAQWLGRARYVAVGACLDSLNSSERMRKNSVRDSISVTVPLHYRDEPHMPPHWGPPAALGHLGPRRACSWRAATCLFSVNRV